MNSSLRRGLSSGVSCCRVKVRNLPLSPPPRSCPLPGWPQARSCSSLGRDARRSRVASCHSLEAAYGRRLLPSVSQFRPVRTPNPPAEQAHEVPIWSRRPRDHEDAVVNQVTPGPFGQSLYWRPGRSSPLPAPPRSQSRGRCGRGRPRPAPLVHVLSLDAINASTARIYTTHVGSLAGRPRCSTDAGGRCRAPG